MNSLRLYRAHSWWDRLIGLHAYDRLPGNTGLWLGPCQAVHTFGLAYAIDVVFLDSRKHVVKQVNSLVPYRFTLCLAAESVVELPAGYCGFNPDYADRIRRALTRFDRSVLFD